MTSVAKLTCKEYGREREGGGGGGVMKKNITTL